MVVCMNWGFHASLGVVRFYCSTQIRRKQFPINPQIGIATAHFLERAPVAVAVIALSCVGFCKLGRPLGYLIFSLMALTRDPIYEYFSNGFRGQPR